MLSFGGADKDVPVVDVDVNAAVFGILKHLLPKRDLLIDRHLLDNAQMGWVLDAFVPPPHVRLGIDDARVDRDVIQSHVLIAGNLDHRRIRMQVPQREQVVAISGHIVQVVLPEVELPHGHDIRLRGIAGIVIARRPRVQRDIELDASVFDVRPALDIARRQQVSSGLQIVSESESGIHEASRVPSPDVNRFAFLLNGVGLRVQGLVQSEGDHDRAVGAGGVLEVVGLEGMLELLYTEVQLRDAVVVHDSHFLLRMGTKATESSDKQDERFR